MKEKIINTYNTNQAFQEFIDEYYGDGALITGDFRLMDFFDFEPEELCNEAKKHIQVVSRHLVPLFRTGYSIIGYWTEENNVYVIDIGTDGDIFFFGNISVFEYLVLNGCRQKRTYKKIQNVLAKNDIIVRDKKKLKKIFTSLQKESKILKKILSTFENIFERCRYGRALDPEKYTVSKSEYKKWMYPMYGDDNPTKIKTKVWEYAVASRKSAYGLKDKFGIKNKYDPANPAWSFDRFGKSITFLDDGTEIHIAGEHEDSYDPDFFIYNDVVVVHPDDSIDFYLYPEKLFVPTDFHSATLHGEEIIMIGNLGYDQDRKYGHTQVYKLSIKDFKIKKVDTTGEMPGWIHGHKATLDSDNNTIIIEGGLLDIGKGLSLVRNVDKWELNLETKVWNRLTSVDAREINYKRKDDNWHNLFDFYIYCKYDKNKKGKLKQLIKELGYQAEPQLYEKLYEFRLPDTVIIENEDYSKIKIQVGDNIVEIDESGPGVKVLILGAISTAKYETIRDTILENLERLEQTEYIVEENTR